MPPVRISELSSFDLQHGVAINMAGGSVQAMELAAPLWIANFTTAKLNSKQRAQVQAWWATLRGGVRTFYGWDCFRAYPAFYGSAVIGMPRAAGGSFTGTCTVTANGITTVSLSGLPANYHATDGDMIELPRASGKSRCIRLSKRSSVRQAERSRSRSSRPRCWIRRSVRARRGLFRRAASWSRDRGRFRFRLDSAGKRHLLRRCKQSNEKLYSTTLLALGSAQHRCGS